MDLYLDDHYPADAAFGADFFTNAAQGEVVMEGPDGPIVRQEKVLISDRQLDDVLAYGRVCIGERTVRHLAHKLEMVDGWRVQRIAADNEDLRAELVDLSRQLARERQTVQFMRDLEAHPPAEVYLALDGTTHTSKRACQEATAKLLGVTTRLIQEAVPVPLSAVSDPEART